MHPADLKPHRILIIGAGPAGLCMGVQLKRAGIDDFIILEKGAGVGGTWFWNRYPGAECDVESHLYAFSFDQKLDWSRPFAGQQEILDYLNGIADKHDLRRHISFDTAVAGLTWHHDSAVWQVTAKDGTQTQAQVVVSAIGMFNDIHWPDTPGLKDFEGDCWHSARWNGDHDLSEERVAVIGMAASAIQLVPEIAPVVQRLYLFQRTANWVVPKPNDPYTVEEIDRFRRHPETVQHSRNEIYEVWNTLATFGDKAFLADMEKAGLERIAQVRDRDTREKLTPDYPFGCKRPLFSDLYYPIFNRDNVELITEPIRRIDAHSITTADGNAVEVDTIICATGFETTRFLAALEVKGRNGITIEEAWRDGAQAYLGMSTAGFPNLFMLYGPNTNQGSLLYMLERQSEFVLRQLKRLEKEHLAWIDVRPEIMTAFNERLQADIDHVEVWKANCGNDFYYRAPSGRFVTQWPHSMDDYAAATRTDLDDAYEVSSAPGRNPIR